MARSDVIAGNRAALAAWRDAGYPVAPPELATVPPCRDCGFVPTQYHRCGAEVVCLDRAACYGRQDAK